MDVALVVIKGSTAQKEVPIQGGSVIIGRKKDCKLCIPSSLVSRMHCEVRIEDDELFVRDLGSSNGTLVNGAKIRETSLGPGDTLGIGPVTFLVKIDGDDGGAAGDDFVVVDEDETADSGFEVIPDDDGFAVGDEGDSDVAPDFAEDEAGDDLLDFVVEEIEEQRGDDDGGFDFVEAEADEDEEQEGFVVVEGEEGDESEEDDDGGGFFVVDEEGDADDDEDEGGFVITDEDGDDDDGFVVVDEDEDETETVVGAPAPKLSGKSSQSSKSFATAALLNMFLGNLGVDRFYSGQPLLGVLRLLTFGGLGIWSLIDFIMLAAGKRKDSSAKPLLPPTSPKGKKSYLVTMLLALFLGTFGADRFYRGQILLGVGKLLTIGGLGWWALIDLVMLVAGQPKDSKGNLLGP